MNFLKSIWNWLTGNTKYGNDLLNALQTSGPVSYSKNSETGETTGGLSSIINRVTQDDLTGSESAMNAFNSEEAQKNRDWQEYMSNTSYQRATADMQAAGLNPALLMGRGSSGASTPSGSVASGSLGSSPIGLSEIMSILRFRKDLSMLDAQIKNIGADTVFKHAQANAATASAGLSGAQRELTMKQVKAFDPMNEAQLNNLKADLENKDVQRRLSEANINLVDAQRQLEANNALLAGIDAKYRDRLNDLNVRLRVSELGLNEERKKAIIAETNELYQRAILEAAQAGMYDQQIINLAEELGILRLNKESNQFSVDHQKADRNWRIAGQVIGAVTSTVGAAAGVAGAYGIVRNSIGASRLGFQQSISGYSLPSFTY